MPEHTYRLEIRYLSKEEADAIFYAAVEICERNVDGSLYVEIEKRNQHD